MSEITAGAEVDSVQTTTQTDQSATQSTPVQFSDDTQFIPPGAKDPVKYGEWYRGLQSQLTKKSQEASRMAQERQQYQQALAQREEAIKRYEAHIRSLASGSQSNPLESFKQLQYLSGEDAYKLAETLQGQFGGFGQQLARRDQVLTAIGQALLELKQQFSSVQEERASRAFENKISDWVKSLGYGDEALEPARLFYLAHEGPDLDQEFPAMFKSYWENQQKTWRATEKARIDAARSKPFVPGKGGAAAASKPLDVPANATAAQIADFMWAGLQGDKT